MNLDGDAGRREIHNKDIVFDVLFRFMTCLQRCYAPVGSAVRKKAFSFVMQGRLNEIVGETVLMKKFKSISKSLGAALRGEPSMKAFKWSFYLSPARIKRKSRQSTACTTLQHEWPFKVSQSYGKPVLPSTAIPMKSLSFSTSPDRSLLTSAHRVD